MRISIVTGFFLPVPPVRGGSTEKIWHRLAREFSSQKHEVTFISRAWPGFPDRETADWVRHIRLRGWDHSAFLPVNLWKDLRWGWKVSRALPPADVVICNTVALPVWLRRSRPDAGKVVAVVARMPKGRGRAYGNVDLILALGDEVADRLRSENPRLAPRIAPFPYPIDWELHAKAGANRPGPPEPLTIGYIGRLHPEKGLDILLEAAELLASRRDLPAWRLQIVGPANVAAGGGGETWWHALQARHAITLREHLTWCGPVFDSEALANRYGNMDIFCYPSVAEQGETFGVAVAEAMAAGCAPVVSGLACFRQLVREGETGLSFAHGAPGAAERLSEALARLLSDADLRRSIAGRAQEHARAFDYAASARILLPRLARLAELGPTRG
jgi:glycosyltransferase involved in cell wall biosynthesis